jgi:hypothetical protein
MDRISIFENPASFAYFLKVEGIMAAPVALELGHPLIVGDKSIH